METTTTPFPNPPTHFKESQMNYSIVNSIDTTLIIGQVSVKTIKEVYKIVRILTLVTYHLLQIVWIVAQDVAAQQVEASLEKEIKLLEPTKEVKMLMPSLEPKIMKAQKFISVVADVEDLSEGELRQILAANKVKGHNLIKKFSTLQAKVAAL